MKNRKTISHGVTRPSSVRPLEKCMALLCLLALAACSPAIPRMVEAATQQQEAATEPDTAPAQEQETAASTDTTTTDEAEHEEHAAILPAALGTKYYMKHANGAIAARSCEYDAVQSAVSYAGAGTTIRIPAGDCNWGTKQLDVPAGIYLQGAGENATIIRRDGYVPNTRYLIAYDCTNGRQAIFSGMTLIGNGNGAIQDKGLGLLNGCRDFKVHDSKFTHFIFSAVYVGDAPNQRGVIYQNRFIDNFSASLMNLGYGVVVYGGGSWPRLQLGTKNAVFVEDNYFSGNRHNIASNNGSVYVFRHNIVIGQDPAKDFAMTDAHGLSSSPRGSRSFEIYDNTYLTHIDDGMQRTAIGIRGGDGVIFNNTIAGRISRGVELFPEGFECGTYPGPDQIRSVYIWNNKLKAGRMHGKNGIDNDCPQSIKLNRDYFLKPMPGYKPYPYPHPLRRQTSANNVAQE
jgi:hypothetical protein